VGGEQTRPKGVLSLWLAKYFGFWCVRFGGRTHQTWSVGLICVMVVGWLSVGFVGNGRFLIILRAKYGDKKIENPPPQERGNVQVSVADIGGFWAETARHR